MTGMGTPALSIVTPVFNGRAHIERCVENVISQGFDGVEHIVIDGGSTDGTVEWLRRTEAKMQHLRVVSESDRGQSDALNKGIALARSPVVGVLNVDDYYEPDVLRRAATIFERLREPSVVVGNCHVRDVDGSIDYVNRPRRLRLWQLLLGPEITLFPVNPSAYFYHRSIHDVIGPYDVDEHLAMDLDFLLHAARVTQLHYVDETWGNFCLSPSCKTYQSFSEKVAPPEREAVYARHRAMLPQPKRFVVTFFAGLSESKFGELARFCWRRPDLAIRSFGRRLRRLFGLD